MQYTCRICNRKVSQYYNIKRVGYDEGSDILCVDCYMREKQKNDTLELDKENIRRQIQQIEQQISAAKSKHARMWDDYERYNNAGGLAQDLFWSYCPAKPLNYSEVETLHEQKRTLERQLYKDGRTYNISDHDYMERTEEPEPAHNSRFQNINRDYSFIYWEPSRKLKLLSSIEEVRLTDKIRLQDAKERKERIELVNKILQNCYTETDVNLIIKNIHSYSDEQITKLAGCTHSPAHLLRTILRVKRHPLHTVLSNPSIDIQNS